MILVFIYLILTVNPEMPLEYRKRKYQEDPEIHKKQLKKRYLEYQEKKKCDKIEYFLH